jgi:hypothetical protein
VLTEVTFFPSEHPPQAKPLALEERAKRGAGVGREGDGEANILTFQPLPLKSDEAIVFGTLFAERQKRMGLEYAHDLFSRFPPLAKEGQGGFDGVGEYHHRKSPSVPLFQRGKCSLANNVPDTIGDEGFAG